MFDPYNTWFLDMQVNDRKTFHFTHDPRGDQDSLGQELEWQEYRGYVFDPDTMTARPKTP